MLCFFDVNRSLCSFSGRSDREGEAGLQRDGRLHGPRCRLPPGETLRGQRRRQQVRRRWRVENGLKQCQMSRGRPLCEQGHHH